MQNIDWNNLGFDPNMTRAVVISRFKDGEWSEPEVSEDLNFNLSAYAGVYHYANSCFEGLKAFRGIDGKIRLFRTDENAKRLIRSAEFLAMPAPSEQLFIDMCVKCVNENIDFLPPFGYNAAMYLRPVLIGTNGQINLRPSTEAIFAVLGSAVGSYSGAKSLVSLNAVISRDFDRAAPNGTGSYKLSANYAPSFRAYQIAHSIGYNEILFLDPATKTKVDEFGSSNFLAIKGNTYVTPLSNSVLPSITNKSLQTLAADFGLNVEKRIVPVEELAEFDEVNACGTAVVITPIYRIYDKPTLTSETVTKEYNYAKPGVCGPVSAKLYHQLRGIQDGLVEDTHNWCLTM